MHDEHIVISIHGIETTGAWQKKLAGLLPKHQLDQELLDYDLYRALKMVYPPSRQGRIDWFRDEYNRIRTTFPNARLSIIAHSFGTYLTAEAMLKDPNIKFDKLIFCGSIVRQDYPWTEVIKNGQANRVLNQFGGFDFWAWVVVFFVADSGRSGRDGFSGSDAVITQQKYPRYRHSDWFTLEQFRNSWIPFLKGGSPGNPPVSFKGGGTRQFKVMALILFVLLVSGAICWIVSRTGATPPLSPVKVRLTAEDGYLSVPSNISDFWWLARADINESTTLPIRIRSISVTDFANDASTTATIASDSVEIVVRAKGLPGTNNREFEIGRTSVRTRDLTSLEKTIDLDAPQGYHGQLHVNIRRVNSSQQ